MTIRNFTSREFNQDVSAGKKAAQDGPVAVTDRGRPAHVLLSIDGDQQPAKHRRNIADALAMPGDVHFEFEAPRYSIATELAAWT